jgi:hypothetical protein
MAYAKGAYNDFMNSRVGKAVQDTWNKYYAMPLTNPVDGGAYSAANPPTTETPPPSIETPPPTTESPAPSTETPPPSTESPAPSSGVPTYEEWLANGGKTNSAYTNYQNSVKEADKRLAESRNAAMTNYALARSNYGAEAEAMRSSGLTGGYSDYLDSKAYALAQGDIASAERTAAETKRDAERDLYTKYDEIAAEEKSKAQELEKIKIDSLGYSPDELYALSKSVNGTISEDEYNTIVNDWITYNEKKGNTSAISEYGKLSGNDYSERESKANTVQGQNIDVSGADVNNPVALLTGIPEDSKSEVVSKLASKYVSDGNAMRKTSTDTSDKNKTKIHGVTNFNEGQNITLWNNDNKAYTEIKETYTMSSDMGKLLNQIEGNSDSKAAIVILGGVVYVRSNTKSGGAYRWIKTGIKADGIGEY